VGRATGCAVMTDATTRAKERTGGGLTERLRADELPAYTVARDVACGVCLGGGRMRDPDPALLGAWIHRDCTDCTRGRVPYESLDLLRLLAFLGVEEANSGRHPIHSEWADGLSLDHWLDGLFLLLAKLPPHRLLVNSTRPLVYALDRRVDSGLVEIKTDWPRDTPAEHWLMADAALACGLECLPAWWKRAPWPDGPRGTWENNAPRSAILAGQAWVEEPTPLPGDPAESLSVCEGIPEWAAGLLIHTGHVTGDEVLLDAATVIGEPRVREVVTAALLGRLL